MRAPNSTLMFGYRSIACEMYASFFGAIDLVGLHFGVAGLFDAAEPGLREDQEPLGIGRMPILNHLVESRAAAAGQVHHRPYVLAVHHRENLFGKRIVYGLGDL